LFLRKEMDEINIAEPEKRNRNIKKFFDKDNNVGMRTRRFN